MRRAGNAWGSAAFESFFSSLKTELISRKIYCTRDEACAVVFDCIERFCNPHRNHSSLGYESPIALFRGKVALVQPVSSPRLVPKDRDGDVKRRRSIDALARTCKWAPPRRLQERHQMAKGLWRPHAVQRFDRETDDVAIGILECRRCQVGGLCP